MKSFNWKYFLLLSLLLLHSCTPSAEDLILSDTTLSTTNSISSSLATNLKVDLVSAGVDEESAATITDTALSASLAGSLQQKIAMRVLAAESAQTSLYQQIATKFVEGAMKGVAKTNLSAELKQTAAGINAYTPIRSMTQSATDLSEAQRKAAVEAISNQAVAKLQETGLDTNELADAISNIGEKSVEGVSQTGVSAEEARELVQSATGGATKGLTDLTEISADQAENYSSDLAEGSIKGIANFDIEGVQSIDLIADVTTGLNEGLVTVESQIEGFNINTATAGVDASIQTIAAANTNNGGLGLDTDQINDAISSGKSEIASLYQVIFDANGGTGSMVNLALAENTSANLTPNAYTRADYIFLGWATSSGATTVAYNDGASYTMGSSNVTLYAVWCDDCWVQQAYLKAPNAEGGDRFGNSVSVSGDTIVVGAFYEDSNQTMVSNSDSLPTAVGDNDSASNAGAAYVFTRSGTTWSQQAYLKAPNAEGGDEFGSSVSISGDTIVVGARYERSNQTTVSNSGSLPTAAADNDSLHRAGAAYVFTSSGTTWSQQAYLKAPNRRAYDWFGSSVSISGDTIVIGSQYDDSYQTSITNNIDSYSTYGSNGGVDTDVGSAYVFTRSGSTWSQQAYLKATNAGAGDRFGRSVSVFGETIVVGAFYEDSNQTTVTNGTSASSNNSYSKAGAVYVFARSGTTWSQKAYLKAPNAEASDRFGNSVSVSGDTIVVGAYLEDSDQTTVSNSDSLPTALGDDDSAGDAGAAYVFTRSDSIWSQQAYLKAPNAEAGDRFGYSVSVSGDTIVVGAYFEDSNQTTVTNSGSLPTALGDDDSAGNAGAVYVFVRSGTTWSQKAYLKATNAEVSDNFGYSVSVSGDTIVVGAYLEDSNQTTVSNSGSLPTASGDNDSAGNAGAAYVFVR